MEEDHVKESIHNNNRKYFSVFSLLIASAFWVWAIVNCIRNSFFDAGTISFLSVILAHAYLLMHKRGDVRHPQRLVLASHLVVVVTYCVGIFASTATTIFEEKKRQYLTIYFISGATIWLLSAISGFKLFRTEVDGGASNDVHLK